MQGSLHSKRCARWLREQAPGNLLDDFARTKVPKLQLLRWTPGAGQHLAMSARKALTRSSKTQPELPLLVPTAMRVPGRGFIQGGTCEER
eukprot:260739-Pleurochrysis_carterae.AAC.2